MPATKDNWAIDYREAYRRKASQDALNDIYDGYKQAGGTETPKQLLSGGDTPAASPQTASPSPQVPPLSPSAAQTQAAIQSQTTPAAALAQMADNLQPWDTSRDEAEVRQLYGQALEQSNREVDQSVREGVNSLVQTEEEAARKYQTQRNQVATEEAHALDNQALYNAAQGDRGGIGTAQIAAVQARAMQNRTEIQNAQNQMSVQIAREITNLYANGEFQKGANALQILQSMTTQLYQLRSDARAYNLNVDQFKAGLYQWFQNIQLQLAQMEREDERWQAEMDYRWQTFDIGVQQWQAEFDYNQRQSELARQERIWRYGVEDERYADETAYNRAWNQRQFDYQQSRDAVSDAVTAWNMDRQEQNDAFDRAVTIQNLERQTTQDTRSLALSKLESGMTLSDTELAALNITRADAESIARSLQASQESAAREADAKLAKAEADALKAQAEAAKALYGTAQYGSGMEALIRAAADSGNPLSYIKNHAADYGFSKGVSEDEADEMLFYTVTGGLSISNAGDGYIVRWTDGYGNRNETNPEDDPIATKDDATRWISEHLYLTQEQADNFNNAFYSARSRVSQARVASNAAGLDANGNLVSGNSITPSTSTTALSATDNQDWRPSYQRGSTPTIVPTQPATTQRSSAMDSREFHAAQSAIMSQLTTKRAWSKNTLNWIDQNWNKLSKTQQDELLASIRSVDGSFSIADN